MIPQKQSKWTIAAALVLATTVSAPAWSVPFQDGGAALQTVLNDITVGGDSNVNVVTGAPCDFGPGCVDDTNWQIGRSAGLAAQFRQ